MVVCQSLAKLLKDLIQANGYEHPGVEGYNFISGGTAPSYLKGTSTYFGGSHAREHLLTCGNQH